jgi:cupin 2 domain-containing protein
LIAGNLYDAVPECLPEERVETLAATPSMRILRIVSIAHTTPPGTWYDQADTEWVLLVQGQARVVFEREGTRSLKAGDYLLIPAGCRHRVEWTSTAPPAIWLAIHYRDRENPGAGRVSVEASNAIHQDDA